MINAHNSFDMREFSIVTSVYKNDKEAFVSAALDSMLVTQSVKPNEIVLVQDGPVPYELSRLLLEYKDKYGEVVVELFGGENRE